MSQFNTPTENHYFILTFSALPPQIKRELNKKGTKSKPIINHVIYNDIDDLIKLSTDPNYISELNTDKTNFINIFKAYFDTQTIEDTQEAYDEALTDYKKAKLEDKELTLQDYDEDLFNVISKANEIKQKHHPYFHKHFKINDKIIPVQPKKDITKITSYDALIRTFQNSEYIIIVNTLAKDFQHFTKDIKQLVDYGLVHKKMWMLCDLSIYKLIGLEGTEIKPGKEYLIKF